MRAAAWQARLEGRAEGAVWAVARIKRAQHDIVDDARLYRRRWHVQCAECRQRAASRDWRVARLACPPDPHGMCACPTCVNRTRETFGEPIPGEYTGGPTDPW